jgi:hypothetical protein
MARRSSGKHTSRETRHVPPLHAASARNAAGQVAGRKRRRKPRYKLFHQIVDHLHDLLPARFPVDVRLGWPGERCYGVCGLGRRRFDICVSSRLSEEFAIEVLIHEWAHALSWPRDERRFTYRWQPYSIRGPIDHDAAWGRAYAKVYSTVLFAILPRIRKAERAALRLRQKGLRK